MPSSIANPTWRSTRSLSLLVLLILIASISAPGWSLAGGTSRAGHGVLQVTTDPPLDSAINVDGVARNTGSVKGLELPVGEHDVCFGAIEGYLAPPCATVQINEGDATPLVGTFVTAGQLEIDVEPQGLDPMVTVAGIERDRGATNLTLAEGDHEVCFESLSGYHAVPCQQASVQQDTPALISATYSRVSDESSDPEGPDRVSGDLVALYDFADGAGSTVTDVAGLHAGLDLQIVDSSRVSWTEQGLSFDRPTLARTSTAPKAFYDAVASSNEFTVEAWVTPANTTQNGPARIVTFGKGTSQTNLLVGQGAFHGSSELIETRLHERTGDYRLRTANGSLSSVLTHVVMTRAADATVSVYLDGKLSTKNPMATSLHGWDSSYLLGIGSELSGERPWLGTYHLVALYDAALDTADVTTNYLAGPNDDTTPVRTVPDESADPEESDPDPAPSVPPSAPSTSSKMSSISQHGITWTFDKSYTVGTYANGDFWVEGPVILTKLDPPSVTVSGRTINGSMINPSPGHGIGYGQMRDVSYNAAMNVAAGLSTSNPLQIGPHSSLVSTISVPEGNGRPGIDTAAVLTVVDKAPAANSFRPPYSGTDKTARFTTDQLRYDLLPSLPRVPGTPNIDVMADNFQRVWLDHREGWTGRSIHPKTSMPDYGRDLASRLGEGSLMLMLDYSDAQKQRLVTNLVQVGIDLYGVADNGGERNWVPNGGHAQGRKWPILLAGTMLQDPAMANIGHRGEIFFGEDAQTFYVTQREIDRGTGYSTADLGLPEFGIRHATDPSRNDKSWNAPYRQCCTANSWSGHILSARLMGLQNAWNHDPLFDYTDRFVGRQPPTDWQRFWNRPFTETMWETYR